MAINEKDRAALEEYLDTPRVPRSTEPYLRKVWILVLGSGGVGKKNLLTRVVLSCFYGDEYDPTGDGVPSISMRVLDRPVITDWMRWHAEPSFYIKDHKDGPFGFIFETMHKADGFLFMFSITSQRSFDRVKEFYQTWREEQCTKYTDQQKQILIVAGKCDLEAQEDYCDPKLMAEAQKWCDERGLPLYRVSSKTAEGLGDEVVQDMVMRIMLGKIRGEAGPEEIMAPAPRRSLLAKMKSLMQRGSRKERAEHMR